MVNNRSHKKTFFQKLRAKRLQHLFKLINQCERAKFHYRKLHNGQNPTTAELQTLTGLSKSQISKVNKTMKRLARQDQKLEKIIEKHTKKIQ